MIDVTIDSNELSHNRAEDLVAAVAADTRFKFSGYADLISDVRFSNNGQYFNVELKEPADFISSINSGHLYEQILALREAVVPAVVIILGDDTDVNQAIKDATLGRRTKRSRGETIITYQHKVQHFESVSYALRVPCLRFKSSPWARLLSHADKILNDADLLQHCPRPAGNERHVAALMMCVGGVGKKRARDVMKHYKLQLVPRDKTTKKLEDLPGIGPMTADAIRKALMCVEVPYPSE